MLYYLGALPFLLRGTELQKIDSSLYIFTCDTENAKLMCFIINAFVYLVISFHKLIRSLALYIQRQVRHILCPHQFYEVAKEIYMYMNNFITVWDKIL